MKPASYGAAAALAAGALWPLRRALLGEALFARDIHLVWHAHAEAFVRTVAAGAAPLWDAGSGFGRPMLADPDFMAAYPLTWLNLLMPAWAYYTLFALAHLIGAGAGVYALARRWRASAPAAAVGGAVWMLSGPLLSLVCLWHHFASTCWMPWIFLTADRALLTRRWRHVAAWGLALGAQILAGSADVVAMTLLALAAYLAVFRMRLRPLSGRRNRAALAAAGSALALALLVSAVQWLPALDAVRRSPRRALAASTRTYWSVHPGRLAETVAPAAVAAMPSASPARDEAEGREPFLGSLYLGLATVPLVGAALAGGGRRAWFFALVAAAAMVVSLGRHAPFYSALVTVLPPLRVLRYPEKAFALGSFAWAVACALGTDAWRRTVPSRRLAASVLAPAALAGAVAVAVWLEAPLPLAGVSVAVAACAVAIAGARVRLPRRAAALAAAAGGLAVADLALVHAGALETAPRQLYAKPPLVEVLRQRGAQRLYVYDYATAPGPSRLGAPGPPGLARHPPGWRPAAAVALAQQAALQPVTAGRWALDTGYEADIHALAPYALAQLSLLPPHLEGTPRHIRLLRMGAITHVVALHREGLEGLALVAAVPGLFERPALVFEVPAPLPRAYAVSGARVVPPEPAGAFGALLDPSFDPESEVLVGPGAAAAAGGRAGRVRITERRPGRVRMQADMERAGFLVLVEAFDPGWRARVDGRDHPVLNANLAFQAVALGPGRHEVEMRYAPASAAVGLALSLLGLASAAAMGTRA